MLANAWSRTHLFRSHRHLIVDNVEEDTFTAHRLVQRWLPSLESALLIADDDGGYRTFLGADPEGAAELAALCDRHERLTSSHVMSTELVLLTRRITRSVSGPASRGPEIPDTLPAQEIDPLAALEIPRTGFRFYPQMIAWVASEVRRLVQDEGVAPGQIALLAPFVSDALRFSLARALGEHAIALTTHRPSRALEDEPAARALITLAQLAHPDWELRPAPEDVTLALTLVIGGLDPVRAHLLSQIVYPPRRRSVKLGRFATLVADAQERITFSVGERYDRLHDWLTAYRAGGEVATLDQFLAQLFGELLSQPGFGFHADHNAARVANQMVESARKFRWALEGSTDDLPTLVGRAYVKLFEEGALGALYVPGWREAEDAVFLAPAYTFLMRNRPVDVQFWLDIGSVGLVGAALPTADPPVRALAPLARTRAVERFPRVSPAPGNHAAATPGAGAADAPAHLSRHQRLQRERV